MAAELPSASMLEGARFTALGAPPNVAQGLFRRRRSAVAVATRLDVDGHAVGLIRGLRRSYGDGPGLGPGRDATGRCCCSTRSTTCAACSRARRTRSPPTPRRSGAGCRTSSPTR